LLFQINDENNSAGNKLSKYIETEKFSIDKIKD